MYLSLNHKQLSSPPLGLTFIVYDDADSWPDIYDTNRGRFFPDLTCEDRTAASHHTPVAISEWGDLIQRVNQARRPKFWYFTLVCCDCPPDAMEGIEFEVHSLNNKTQFLSGSLVPYPTFQFVYSQTDPSDHFHSPSFSESVAPNQT